jgi:[calcium/calmodulin-dependent protein kinase] kinase
MEFTKEFSEEYDMIVYITYKYTKEIINGKKIINGMFELDDKIGEGSFWKVYRVKRNLILDNFTDNNTYVFKEGCLDKVDEEELENERRIGMKELAILKELNHENIARLYECIIDEKRRKIIFVMEYCDMGTLMHVDEGQGSYSYNYKLLEYLNVTDVDITFKSHHDALIPLAEELFRQLAHAVQYLHNKCIAHRDIKPENLLFKSDDNNLKLIDFSISKKLPKGEYIDSVHGSKGFIPPEMKEFKPYDPFKVDIYQYGACLYIFLFNKLNFDLNCEEVTFLRQNYPNTYEVLSKCLEDDFDKRPDIDEILSSKWFN